MKIEQYLSGRKDYTGYPIGSNGDAYAGFGCYCRTDDVQQSDRADLDRYFNYYVSREKTKKNTLPTILSKTRLQSGNFALTGQTFIPDDRGNVVSHSYIIPSMHPQMVEPESWFGLPFYRVNLNAASPAEEAERQREGRQIILQAETSLPQSAFVLKPLREVLQRWRLNKTNFLWMLVGAIDSVRLRNHDFLIAYDIDETTEDDMEQLLAWIYLLLPYSYRRTIGFDTLYNGSSNAHQIIFVSAQQIIEGDEIRIRSWESNGTEIRPKLIYLDHAYLYDWRKGKIIHYPAGRELYGTNTPLVRFLVDEIQSLAELDSIEQCRKVMRKFDATFRELNQIIPPYTTDTSVYDVEIYFRTGLKNGSWDELKNAAFETLQAENLPESTKMQNRLFTVTGILKKRAEKESDGQMIWEKFVYDALQRSEFPNQKRFISEMANIIFQKSSPVDLLKKSRKILENRTIEAVSAADQLQIELLRNQDFQKEYIRDAFAEVSAWDDCVTKSVHILQYIESNLREELESVKNALREEIWSKKSQPSDMGSFIYLLNVKKPEMEFVDSVEQCVCDMANIVLDAFAKNPCQTEAYQYISEIGISAYIDFKEKTSNSQYSQYNTILSQFYGKAVLEKWLPSAGTVLTDNINQIFTLLKETGNRAGVEERIVQAVKDDVSWSLFERFRTAAREYNPQDPRLCSLKKRILEQIPIRAEQRARRDILSAEELAEAIAAKAWIQYQYQEKQNVQELVRIMQSNSSVTFHYLISFTEQLDMIKSSASYKSVSGKGSLADSNMKQYGFEIVRGLLSGVIDRLPKPPLRDSLIEFNRLLKLWNDERYAGLFNELRRKLTEDMDVYPEFRQFTAFIRQPNQETAQDLENFGFEHLDITKDPMPGLKNAIGRSPVKKLQTLFAEAISSEESERDYIWYSAYDMVCAELIEKGISMDYNDRLDRTWFENQNLRQLSRLVSRGLPCTGAIWKLCEAYQHNTVIKDGEDPQIVALLKSYYQRGQFRFDRSDMRKLLEMDAGGVFAEQIVKLESPEEIVDLCVYLKRRKDTVSLRYLKNAVQRYRNSFLPGDYRLIMKQFPETAGSHESQKTQRMFGRVLERGTKNGREDRPSSEKKQQSKRSFRNKNK